MGKKLKIAVGVLALGAVAGWALTWPSWPVASARHVESPVAAPGADQDGMALLQAPANQLQGRIDLQNQDDRPRYLGDNAPVLAKNAKALAALHEAVQKPALTWPVPPDALQDAYGEPYNQLREVVLLGTLAAETAIAEHRPADALPPLADALALPWRLANATGRPAVATSLAQALWLIAAGDAYRLHDQILAAPTPALQAFQARLDVLAGQAVPIEAIFAGHRDDKVALWRRPDFPEQGMRHFEDPEPVSLPARWFSAWLRPDPAVVPAYVGHYDRLLDMLARRDFAAMKQAFKGADRLPVSPEEPPRALATVVFHPGSVLPAFDLHTTATTMLQTGILHLRDRAELAGWRVAAAQEVYKRQHGHLPDSLAELMPEPPADPFVVGAALKYAGGRAWSVGPDQADDHGTQPPPVEPNGDYLGYWPDTKGDVVVPGAGKVQKP